MAAPITPSLGLWPLVYHYETTPYLVHLSCLLMCEVEETHVPVRSSGVTPESVCWLRHGYTVPVQIRVITNSYLIQNKTQKSTNLTVRMRTNIIWICRTCVWRPGSQNHSHVSWQAFENTLFLGYLVGGTDLSLKNIHILFDLFGFVSKKATGNIHWCANTSLWG